VVPDSLVHLERGDDGVALITLDRPKANALSIDLLAELEAVVDSLSADLPGAVVVWGGPRIFAAGADIAGFGGPEEARPYGRQFRAAFDKLAALPRTVVAAVTGYALGGGCELALACDLRVVAADARMGQPEILLGLIPGAGGTQRLTRLVGAGRAKDLILTGRNVDAEEASRIGLADRVVPSGEVLDAARSLAGTLAAGPLVAASYAKRAIDAGMDTDLASGLDMEQELFIDVFNTEDAQVGIRSFLDHGPGQATFSGR
jgi:enoyl-CoA hydratase